MAKFKPSVAQTPFCVYLHFELKLKPRSNIAGGTTPTSSSSLPKASKSKARQASWGSTSSQSIVSLLLSFSLSGLNTDDVRAQRPRSGGRADALFDQIILRCLMRTGVTARSLSDKRHRSVAWPHPLKIWRVIVRVKIQFQTQELEQ